MLSNNQAIVYLFKVDNRNTRKRCEICLKLTIKTPETTSMRFLFCNFEHILQYFGVFQLLTLNKCLATNQTENDGEKKS